ncbi:bifunctional glutathione transferase/peroxidase [Diatrype stigma]|uniref:Bifunctional glutathione transferase/peroxidase n=1 Tax=Diatrype stigma TaxID=117547 RepID=A0AAN9UMW0_9PEZI
MATEEQPKITLYWLEKSRAQNILWLLEELGLEYELETFHRNKDDNHAPAELREVHPLGKSPLIKITPPGGGEPIVLAESGFITQYLCEHFGKNTTMMPQRYREGQEGQVCGETPAWLRWQYFLHFAEGTMMSTFMMAMVVDRLRSPQVPFYIRPITTMVANKIFAGFISHNIQNQQGFLDQQLAVAGAGYLCGKDLSAADILISFGLITAKDKVESFGDWWGSTPRALYPRLYQYIERLENEEGYKRSIQKVKEIDESLGINFRL